MTKEKCIFSKKSWWGKTKNSSFFNLGEKVYENRCGLSHRHSIKCLGSEEEKKRCPQWNKPS